MAQHAPVAQHMRALQTGNTMRLQRLMERARVKHLPPHDGLRAVGYLIAVPPDFMAGGAALGVLWWPPRFKVAPARALLGRVASLRRLDGVRLDELTDRGGDLLCAEVDDTIEAWTGR